MFLGGVMVHAEVFGWEIQLSNCLAVKIRRDFILAHLFIAIRFTMGLIWFVKTWFIFISEEEMFTIQKKTDKQHWPRHFQTDVEVSQKIINA